MQPKRLPGKGWLVLIGGGEFSFGETLEADRAWLEKTAEGPVGFLPTASGSTDYGGHLAEYLGATFERETRTLPIFRQRDARRGKNLARIDEVSAVYMGGGIAEQLLEVLEDSPALEAMTRKLGAGGVLVAMAAAAQAVGRCARTLTGRDTVPGLGWLPDGVVEPNFDPGHDRRLRQLLERSEVHWAVGLPAGSALLLGPEGAMEHVGTVFLLDDPDGDYLVLEGESPTEEDA
jgi:cyanophycinase-like exopeptidase